MPRCTQLELETEGHLGVAGHAAVRFSNPTTGGDALPTIRTEMHRVTKGTATLTTREAASSVWQVFEGTGSVSLNGQRRVILRGDLIAVPSWCEFTISADTELTLFRMSDAPFFVRLNLDRKVTS